MNAVSNLCARGLAHARRLFLRRIAALELNEHETKVLEESAMASNATVRSFMAWRRSVLITALPFLFISTILTVYASIEGALSAHDMGFNLAGKIRIFLRPVASFVLFVSSCITLLTWKTLPLSIKSMRIGWYVAFILPLIPAFFPADWLYRSDYRLGDDLDAFIIRTFEAAEYGIDIYPVLLTIPLGVMQGSLRIRRLLPFSSFPGWVIITVAPFLCALMLGVLLLVVQIGSSPLLFAGSILLVSSPTLYLIFRKLYTHSTTEEEEKRLDMCQRAVLLTQLLGVFFVLVAAWNFEVVVAPEEVVDGQILEEVVISIGDLIPGVSIAFRAVEFVFESAGRIIVNGLFMADTVLAMTLEDYHVRETRALNMVKGRQDMEDMYSAVAAENKLNKTRSMSESDEMDDGLDLVRPDTQPDV